MVDFRIAGVDWATAMIAPQTWAAQDEPAKVRHARPIFEAGPTAAIVGTQLANQFGMRQQVGIVKRPLPQGVILDAANAQHGFFFDGERDMSVHSSFESPHHTWH
jgi:hypothetical protein